ncbi:MAG: DNA adenine methylase, partial [Campylobacter sp.]|nr:DNA adenine methylase [Campylobacter sp.]
KRPYLAGLRTAISQIPSEFQKYFIAPLLSEASIHSNTGGVFKGFYKDKNGVGKFGGSGENALSRILGEISLPMPVFSNFTSDFQVFQSDAYEFSKLAPSVDIAYFDPPYNQHPYGSNYFMLNLIADFKAPNLGDLSEVSGIPNGWNRSNYNKKSRAADEFFTLLAEFRAKYLIISFNSEGFISEDEFLKNLALIGKVEKIEIKYPAYRASRNLRNRNLHVTEYLYIVKKA